MSARPTFHRSFVLASLATAACAGTSAPTTSAVEQLAETCVDLPASADAMINSSSQHQNYGSKPTLRTSWRYSSLLRFDLGAIPQGAAIQSSTLTLHVTSAEVCGTSTVNFHRVKKPWAESTVTYKSFKQQFTGQVLGSIAITSAPMQESVDLTGITQSWHAGTKPNHGVLMRTSSSSETTYVSREGGTPAQQPTLTVCYTQPGDSCSPNPCEHGGTCTNTSSGYTCTCAPGYEGPNCETEIDECAGMPCQNGGTCEDGIGGYTCTCQPGYEGPNCETNTDDCAAAPCQNGGVCTDEVGGYTCACQPGYDGANCEHEIDECAGMPCQNGGVCTDVVGGYTCTCQPGYDGANCENDIDECAASPCQNGGTCIDGVDSFTCSCTPGWGGPLCETSTCDDGNVCTLDSNTASGCVYTQNASGPACRAAAQSLASGANHTCAIREGGKVYCWGRRNAGQLGDGSMMSGYALTPVEVTGLTDAVAIDAGLDHTCAVRATGQVACWGGNSLGQLGTGTTTSWPVPVAVAGITDAVSVAAGNTHTCVLRGSGEIWCFGRGLEGQLGHGAFPSSALAPVKVIDDVDLVGPLGSPVPHAPTPWVSVSANELFTCGMRATGEVLCWGVNGNGQLGYGALGNRSQPSLVADLPDAIAIAAGRTHACAVKATGNVACWGASGALGRSGPDLLAPELIGSLTSPFDDAVTISAHGEHTCATTTLGRTWCWGKSLQWELAQTSTSALPVAIPGPEVGASSVATSSSLCHSCTLLEDGSLRCWGSLPHPSFLNDCKDHLGNNTTGGSLTPVTPLLPGP